MTYPPILTRLLAALLVAVAGSASADQGITDTTITLGSYSDLSGPAAIWGVSSVNAMRLAFDQANAAGGVHGRKIQFIVEDHQYQVPLAVKAMNKLITRDAVFATVGTLGTPHNLATMERQFQARVPNLFPVAGSKAVFGPQHPLKFTALSTYYEQVRFGVRHFVKKGAKTVCAMVQETEFGDEVRQAIEDELAAARMKLAQVVTHKATATEFVPSITALKAANCDLIVFGTIARDTIVGYATARKMGVNADIFCSQACLDQLIAGVEGGVTQGLYSAGALKVVYEDQAPEAARPFVKAYRERYGEAPSVAAQIGYLYASLTLQGLRNAGRNLSVESLQAGLEQIKGYTDVFGSGPYTFSRDSHHASGTVVLSQVRAGRWVAVGP